MATNEKADQIRQHHEELGRKAAASNLARIYEQVDRDFPGLDAPTRERLAAAFLRQRMADMGKRSGQARRAKRLEGR
jgi:hypothetical protein